MAFCIHFLQPPLGAKSMSCSNDIHSSKPNLGTNRIYIWLGSQSQSLAQGGSKGVSGPPPTHTDFPQPCARWGRIRWDLGFCSQVSSCFPFWPPLSQDFVFAPAFVSYREGVAFFAAIFPVILTPGWHSKESRCRVFHPLFPRLDVFGLVWFVWMKGASAKAGQKSEKARRVHCDFMLKSV